MNEKTKKTKNNITTDKFEKRKKLVHLVKYHWPDNGGGVSQSIDMAIHAFEQYRKYKPEYTQEVVCCWQKNGKPGSKDIYKGVPVYRCKSLFTKLSTPFSAEFLRTINSRVRKEDFVIYNFPYPLVDLAVLFGLIRGTLIVWWHCDFEIKGKLANAIFRPLVNNTLKKTKKVIVSAEGNITGSKTLRKYADKCVVIPFAIDDSLIEEGKHYYRSERQSQPSETVHVLFVGRLVWYKGIDVLLKAYSELDHSKYELTLVGDGPLLDDMKELADSLHLANVNFTGYVSDEEKKEWIKWCDYLVLPSISKAEAFAIVQIEAMTFGKPVINTYIDSGVPYVSKDGVTGITVPPQDTEALRDAIKQLGENAELREKYAENAINLISQKHNMDLLDEKYGNLFAELEKQGK